MKDVFGKVATVTAFVIIVAVLAACQKHRAKGAHSSAGPPAAEERPDVLVGDSIWKRLGDRERPDEIRRPACEGRCRLPRQARCGQEDCRGPMNMTGDWKSRRVLTGVTPVLPTSSTG